MLRSALLLLLVISMAPTVWAQSITRGPYLQTQTDNSIIVRWRTDVATDSFVRFGTDQSSLNLVSSNGALTTEHTVLVDGLLAATKYFYSIGSSTAPIAGDNTYYFSTSPVQGVAANTRIWVIGDSGTAVTHPGQAAAVRDAFKAYTAQAPADFMIMLGDNAYGSGTDTEYQDAVFDTYPEILRRLPVWSTLGNHDGYSANSNTQSGPYYDIFDFPVSSDANGLNEAGGLSSGTEAYYSWNYGNIHFVNLDSYETDRSIGGNMMTWLEADLAMNNLPWVIAIWHHPPYTKGSHDSDTENELIDMRQNALPILEAWGVDLVMSGHSHSYERSMLIDGHYGTAATLDPVTMVLDPGDGNDQAGGDGAYEKPQAIAAEHEGAVYAVAGSSGKVSGVKSDWPHTTMISYLQVLGSMVIDVNSNRLDAVFIDDSGLVRDQFTILKTPDIEPPLIVDANAEDASHVLVDFSERVDAAGAADTANYAIAGLAISAAELLVGNRTVRLTTSVMTEGGSYVLTINDVMDEFGNTIAADSQIGFDFFPQMTKSFQDGLAPTPGYDGTNDAYIREASALTNYGADTTLQVDGDEPSGSGTDMSIVISWDVSDIPASAMVETATIHLNTLNVGGPYRCFALLRAWNQAEVTWNAAANASPWATPGAAAASDRDNSELCNINAGSTGPIAVTLNAAGIALVQSWVDGSAANNGIIIADELSSNGADFDSSESTSAMNRPRLEVTYTVPVLPPNTPPTADFSFSCTHLNCSFTDTSTDSDGSVTAWSWDFGDGNGSTAQNPAHSFTSAGNYTVTLTVFDDESATDFTSTNVTVSEPPQFADYTANGQLPVAGNISGSFADTHTDNGVNQAITERESGGKKQRRYSYLEHKWTFSVAPAAGFILNLNAWSGGSSDGDQFVFSWSTDDVNYTDVLTVNSTDPLNVQSVMLPNSISGTVYIRVQDSDRNAGNRSLDSVYIDHMYIHAENAQGSPPAAPSALDASTLSASSIALAWFDNAADELGFELQRSTDQSTWVGLPNAGTDVQSATDTSLLASTTYYYRIRAYNLSGNSAWVGGASATTDDGPPPPDISLNLTGSKNKGKHVIDLDWSGTTTGSVEIYRDSGLLVSVPDSGSYTDNTGNKGGRTYTYQVCEAGTNNCSAIETIVF